MLCALLSPLRFLSPALIYRDILIEDIIWRISAIGTQGSCQFQPRRSTPSCMFTRHYLLSGHAIHLIASPEITPNLYERGLLLNSLLRYECTRWVRKYLFSYRGSVWLVSSSSWYAYTDIWFKNMCYLIDVIMIADANRIVGIYLVVATISSIAEAIPTYQ